MIGTELILQKLLCKGCHKKNKRLTLLFISFTIFNIYYCDFNEDLGLEVRKYPVKVRNDISTQHREFLI